MDRRATPEHGIRRRQNDFHGTKGATTRADLCLRDLRERPLLPLLAGSSALGGSLLSPVTIETQMAFGPCIGPSANGSGVVLQVVHRRITITPGWPRFNGTISQGKEPEHRDAGRESAVDILQSTIWT